MRTSVSVPNLITGNVTTDQAHKHIAPIDKHHNSELSFGMVGAIRRRDWSAMHPRKLFAL